MNTDELNNWLTSFDIIYTFDNTRYVQDIVGCICNLCCFCTNKCYWATYIYGSNDYQHQCNSNYCHKFGFLLCNECYNSVLNITSSARTIAYRAIDVMNVILVKDVCNMIKQLLENLFINTYPRVCK